MATKDNEEGTIETKADDFRGDITLDEHDTVETVDVMAGEKETITNELDRDTEKTTSEEGAEKLDADAAADAEKPKHKGKFLEDGRYEVTREDGSTFTLNRDELPPAGVSKRRWYQDLTSQIKKNEDELRAEREQHAAEIAELRSRLDKGEQDEQIEEKPWTAKGAEKPSLDDFDSVEDWADARDEWNEAQKAPDPVPPEQQRLQEEFTRDAANLLKEGPTRFKDFDEVVTNNADAPFDPLMSSFLLKESEDAAAVFHHYGTNVEAAREIRAMLDRGDFKGAIRAVVKTEAQLGNGGGAQARAAGGDDGLETDDDDIPSANQGAGSGVETEADNQPAARRRVASRAPEPITPIEGSAPQRADPEREPIDSYITRRAKESYRRQFG